MSFFLVARGPDAGKRIPLTDFPVTVGRDPVNEVVLGDDEVSRFHCRIKKRGRIFVIEDLDSRNGCYVNGDRVLNSIIQNGDRILIGGSELMFVTSDSEIQLPGDILNFDMVVAEQLGLDGPIAVDGSQPSPDFTPIRLTQQHLSSNLADSFKAVKAVFDQHGNITVMTDLDEAANTFLKGIGKLAPSTSRAAFFAWSHTKRQLIPLAARHFKRKKQFVLSHRAFEDVLQRRQGILLQAKSPNVTQEGRNRAVLPMIFDERVSMLVHLECDNPRQTFPEIELEMIQAFIARCAPSFEAFLLRKELDGWLIGMIETLIATIEAKDTYTRGHSERVSKYCMVIADEMRLPRETKRLLMVSALCHDVGKIGIPDNVLKKAALLTAEEYDEMKLHPSIGAEIIKHVPNAKRFHSGVKHHHEKWDGTGYPDGLVGEDIPFFARIVALADVFDAMVSGRSYSGFLDQSDAIEKLHEERELFDPEVFKGFIRAHERGTLSQKTDTQNQIDALPNSKDDDDDAKNSGRVTSSPTKKAE